MFSFPPPSPTGPIVDENGMMTPEFLSWTQEITRRVPFTGSGSPEGVVEAEAGQFYMDTAGTAGSILYIKRDSAVAGDKSEGWILV